VLAGIAESDWPKIGQIVTEIHTAALARDVVALLKSKGFECALEEEEALRGSGVVNCYARRPFAIGPPG
jgi:hypothetical protein